MSTSRIIPLVLILVALLGSSCRRERYGCTDSRAANYDASADVDDGSCDYSSQYYFGDCTPAADGNLVIKNHTGTTLYLYKNYSDGNTGSDAFLTCIPSDTSDFLVYIPNEELNVCLLQIWKADDVDDLYAPDIDMVYRQWSVALSNATLANERANWLITGSDNVAGTGTLYITYPDTDDNGHEIIYQVDVMLNSQQGARLAALQPGISNKKVSIDYGVHYLYHHYWYSDPNSTSGAIEDIGWAETPEVVINEFHAEAYIEIPSIVSDVGKYGELTIINTNNHVVNVYAEDRLIEDICLVAGSSQGLSSIPANSQTTFTVPVDQYTFYCKQLDGGTQDAFSDVSIVQNENTVLRSGLAKKSIQIINNTDVILGLFTLDEEFTGLVIEDHKTSASYTVPASMDTLLLIDFARENSAGFRYASTITVNDLKDYVQNRIEMESTWTLFDAIYESPTINDQEETLMQATLHCVETVVLTFEYNVSSEQGYDKFHFITNGAEQLNESGESGWAQYSQTFEAGTYPLVWRYSKDQSRSEGRDNVWIRNISVN